MSEPIEFTYRDALRLALRDAMTADSSIIVIGEEVGLYGGAYGVTKGLIDDFGPERLIDTPISEAGLVGAAVGAAMTGLRPVAELMYVDFIGLAMDQIANQAAKIRYMFGGQIGVPMLLRTQGGTGRSGAAQHSQSLEAWIMHTPGLRLAMPATVTDAYVLLRHALTLPDPTVFIEHKALYTQKGILDREQPADWGQAKVLRAGSDLTIVTYSRMVHFALEAAGSLADDGIDAEVIDLRTLNPLDRETIVASVAKTGRALVVTEDTLTAGVSAEIAAILQEEAFDWLEEPVIRLAGEDIPIPVAPELEAGSIPSPARIISTARKLMRR
ncbi:alpha-ketoacid dehydrogenase subunit beta [Pelagibius sp. Alg239-R121]|uniref:alpha-ketoacid dehydrogenase subunit beta n=1 Tax=Pelagibius sp. Alg239-R121 TaxID=2993448 RepID=UPI0024A635EF|nr:alpha-ketoacid dehydrogenase subunit beta [Pelagibius sp. Alg239-R121]